MYAVDVVIADDFRRAVGDQLAHFGISGIEKPIFLIFFPGFYKLFDNVFPTFIPVIIPLSHWILGVYISDLTAYHAAHRIDPGVN